MTEGISAERESEPQRIARMIHVRRIPGGVKRDLQPRRVRQRGGVQVTFLVKDADWHRDEEKATVAKYRALLKTLKTALRDGRVY